MSLEALTETTVRNLLHIGLWGLRREGLMEFEQLRAVDKERVRVLGGRPFAAYELRDSTARRAGLEGALLDAARATSHTDVRSLIRALNLDNRSPWNTVCNHCFAEANAAGLVEVKGRLFKTSLGD